MAYVQFKALLNESGDTEWDAEWYTDEQAKEQFGDLQDVTADYEELYHVTLSDEEVALRNDTAATYWDFVSGDRVAAGANSKH